MTESRSPPIVTDPDAPAVRQADRPLRGPLVVIDERTLEEPLEVAIRRARAATPGARVLVVESDGDAGEGGPILHPAPGGRSAPGAPVDATARLLQREEKAVQRVGRLWEHAEEIMAAWVREAKVLAAQLDHEVSRGRSEGVVEEAHRLVALVGWMEASSADHRYRASKTARGMELRGSAELVRDAARIGHHLHPEVDIRLPALEPVAAVYGRAGALCDAFQLAIEAVAHRIGRSGTIRIEIEAGELFVLHRFLGVPGGPGAPGEVPEGLAERLRELVVAGHGGRIFRGDAGGPDYDVTVALPRASAEAPAALDP